MSTKYSLTHFLSPSLFRFYMLSVKLMYLCDREGVPRLLQVTLLTLEPSLVARLQLHDVQRTVRNGRGDQLVTSPFVAIRSSRQDFKHVERLALVSFGENVQDSRGGNLVGGEATFGSGLARVRLDAQQVAKVSQHGFRLTVRFDGVTLRLGGDHRDVGHLVKVILKVRVRVRERSLFGRIVLGREQKCVPVTGVRDEARGVGNAAPNVGRITIRGKRRLRGGQSGGAREQRHRLSSARFFAGREGHDRSARGGFHRALLLQAFGLGDRRFRGHVKGGLNDRSHFICVILRVCCYEV